LCIVEDSNQVVSVVFQIADNVELKMACLQKYSNLGFCLRFSILLKHLELFSFNENVLLSICYKMGTIIASKYLSDVNVLCSRICLNRFSQTRNQKYPRTTTISAVVICFTLFLLCFGICRLKVRGQIECFLHPNYLFD
jgi:hypothetical protein